ncbi:hypothetical protein Tco_1549961 [Tanacetum coccineum]
MAPRGRPTRLNPNATPTPVTPAPNAPTTTTVTEAQLQALINQGVAAAMDEAEASRVRNGYDSNGTKGVVGLTRRFEKMESVFSISNCLATSQVKSVTCTLQDDVLTWWNSHVKTTTPEVAHAIMFPEEVDKIEKYIGGLPDMILGSVKASKSKTMQEVIEFTTELMEDKTHAYAERQAERKRKYDDLPQNNQNQQQQNRRQNTGQAYAAGNGDRKPYEGSKPLCSKWTVGYGLLTTTTITTTTTTVTTTTTTVTTTTTTTVTTTTIISREMVALSAELKATLKETARN